MDSMFLRLTHTGVHADGRPNLNPVLFNDLDTGLEFQHRKVPVYVPVGGSIEIPASTRSLLSYEDGVISRFVTAGVVTAQLFSPPPPVYTNISRPAATEFPEGVMIWNSDDQAPNFSDGAAWRDATGGLT